MFPSRRDPKDPISVLESFFSAEQDIHVFGIRTVWMHVASCGKCNDVDTPNKRWARSWYACTTVLDIHVEELAMHVRQRPNPLGEMAAFGCQGGGGVQSHVNHDLGGTKRGKQPQQTKSNRNVRRMKGGKSRKAHEGLPRENKRRGILIASSTKERSNESSKGPPRQESGSNTKRCPPDRQEHRT